MIRGVMLLRDWNRPVRSGELISSLSMVFGILSVVCGWLVPLPITGMVLGYIGYRRALPALDGFPARVWAKLGFVLSAGGMLGWIAALLLMK